MSSHRIYHTVPSAACSTTYAASADLQQVVLEGKASRAAAGKFKNCYQFARGHGGPTPGYHAGDATIQIPNGSSQLTAALMRDGAIAFPPARPLPEGTRYYLVAAMVRSDEYHFVRLYADGWWGKGSKQDPIYCACPDAFVPSGHSVDSRLLRYERPGGGRVQFAGVGYFLVPAPKK